MKLDQVNDFVVRAIAVQAALEEFTSLFQKKHERWTVRAYTDALRNLKELHHEVFEALFELKEVREELGDDPVVNQTNGMVTPRNVALLKPKLTEVK